MRKSNALLVFITVALLVLITGSAFAQKSPHRSTGAIPVYNPPSPPQSLGTSSSTLAQSDDCNQYTDKGERLKCKFERVNSKIDETLGNIDQLDVLPPTQVSSLKNANSRAARDKDRAGVESFNGLTKKKDVKCEMKECDPAQSGNASCKQLVDPNGICDPGEDCLEVIGDQIGDDKQPCSPLNGNKREVCVEICDQEAINGNKGNFDDQAGADWEQTLGDTADNLDFTNTMMTEAVQRSLAIQVIAADSTDKCANLLIAPKFTYEQLQGVRAGANAAKLAADCCDAGCNQDALGWNCSAVCLAFRLAENIMVAVADGFELQDNKDSGDQVAAMAECLQELGTKINGIETKLNTVIQLLNTPQGRRPDWPIK